MLAPDASGDAPARPVGFSPEKWLVARATPSSTVASSSLAYARSWSARVSKRDRSILRPSGTRGRARAPRVELEERAAELLLDRRDVAGQLVAAPLLVLDPDGREDVGRRPTDLVVALPHERHHLVPLPLDAGPRGGQQVRQPRGVDELERLGELVAPPHFAAQRHDAQVDQHRWLLPADGRAALTPGRPRGPVGPSPGPPGPGGSS